MSHPRATDGTSRASRFACRKGRHSYGEPQNIGAGILRSVCETCGDVTIDLTGVEEITEPVLRNLPRIRSLSTRDS